MLVLTLSWRRSLSYGNYIITASVMKGLSVSDHNFFNLKFQCFMFSLILFIIIIQVVVCRTSRPHHFSTLLYSVLFFAALQLLCLWCSLCVCCNSVGLFRFLPLLLLYRAKRVMMSSLRIQCPKDISWLFCRRLLGLFLLTLFGTSSFLTLPILLIHIM